MNTDTAARPSEYTICDAGRESLRRRLSSTTFWKPGSSLVSPQPVARAGAASASSTRQLARRVARAHHVARHAADGELGEHELLDLLAVRVDRDRAQQHAARVVGVEPVAVAQVVLRREHHRAAVVAGDAPVLAEGDVVVLRQRIDPLRQQRREAALGAAVDLDQLRPRQVAAHGVLLAHDLARHAVHHLELLDVAAGVDVARDARGLAAAAALVDESAAVGELLGGVVDLAQPAEGLWGLGLHRPGSEGECHGVGPQDHLRASPGCSATVST